MPLLPYLLVFINYIQQPLSHRQWTAHISCENAISYLQDYINSGFAYQFSKHKLLGWSFLTLICLMVKYRTQNHRMVQVGRDLSGSSSPTLLPKQGHLQWAAQDLVRVGLEYLQRRRSHNLPGQPVPVLRHPHREEILPHVQNESVVICTFIFSVSKQEWSL